MSSLKEKLQELFTAQEQNIGEYEITLYPHEGVELHVEYRTYLDGYEYLFDVQSINAKVDKTLKPVLDLLGFEDGYVDEDNETVNDAVEEYLSGVYTYFDDLFAELNDFDEFGDIEYHFNVTSLDEDWANFEDFWTEVENTTEIGNFPITEDYTARITKGSKVIEIGCQSTTIDKVRELVARWEEVNK